MGISVGNISLNVKKNVVTYMFASLLSKDLKNLQIKNIQSHMLQGSHKNVIAVCEHTREY